MHAPLSSGCHEDKSDLFTGKPGSQTRLDEGTNLDSGDFIVTAFADPHRKLYVLDLISPRREAGRGSPHWPEAREPCPQLLAGQAPPCLARPRKRASG